MFLHSYFKEIKFLKPYVISVAGFIIISYSMYFFCSDKVVEYLGDEDSLFEWMTAILFLAASVFFFFTFRRSKNFFILGLALIFFFGAGEEIDWGQRLFGFGTPKALNKVNVQEEFNVHNIEIFNSISFTGKKKVGLQRLLDINLLFRIFSIVFCVFIPLFFFHIKPGPVTGKKIRMSVAPITIGIFFLLSWSVFYSLKYFILPGGKTEAYYVSIGEVFECTTAGVYFAIALYFYKRKDDKFLGEDIKQTFR